MLEGGRGKDSVLMRGESASPAPALAAAAEEGMMLRVLSALVQAMDWRVRSAREGRGKSEVLFCVADLDGSRLMGEADLAGRAKLWALSTLGVVSMSSLMFSPPSLPSMLVVNSLCSSRGDGRAGRGREGGACRLIGGISLWAMEVSTSNSGPSSSRGVGRAEPGRDVEGDNGLSLPGRAVFNGEKSSVLRGIGPRWEITLGCWYERDLEEMRLFIPGRNGAGL